MFNDMVKQKGVRTPIVATPGLLKMTLSLSFCLNQRDNLGTGIHRFCLRQHTFTSRSLLKAHIDQHQFITDGGGFPTLADAAYLMAPYGVSLPNTLVMARSAHTRLRVVFDTLPESNHLATQVIDAFYNYIMEQEMEIEEDLPRDQGTNPNLPALLT